MLACVVWIKSAPNSTPPRRVVEAEHRFPEGVPVAETQVQVDAEEVGGGDDIVGIAGDLVVRADEILFIRIEFQDRVQRRVRASDGMKVIDSCARRPSG